MLGSLYSFAVGVSEKANYGLKNNLSNFNPLHGINQATWYGASEVLKADETIIMFLSSSLSLWYRKEASMNPVLVVIGSRCYYQYSL